MAKDFLKFYDRFGAALFRRGLSFILKVDPKNAGSTHFVFGAEDVAPGQKNRAAPSSRRRRSFCNQERPKCTWAPPLEPCMAPPRSSFQPTR
jgi:hypothetical protein